MSAAEKRVARRILAGVARYRWKDAVARKGVGARRHFGLVAQDVAAAFAAQGLDAADYGVWCEDEIMETVETPELGVKTRPTGKKRQDLRYDELLVFLLAAKNTF